jgi:hypothetical protein
VFALRALVVAAAVALATPAMAQPACSGIADPRARLECYDRGQPAPRSAFAPPGGSCTRTSPCVGPRGGVYYHTASGNKRYLPRH